MVEFWTVLDKDDRPLLDDTNRSILAERPEQADKWAVWNGRQSSEPLRIVHLVEAGFEIEHLRTTVAELEENAEKQSIAGHGSLVFDGRELANSEDERAMLIAERDALHRERDEVRRRLVLIREIIDAASAGKD